MKREVEVAPSPAGTLAALAGGGYTVNSAVADLIDNAISGGATAVNIHLDISGRGKLTVEDDGQGMDEDALIRAMQIAGRYGEPRGMNDLGRFGTGMKAASLYLSTCGRFRVSSAVSDRGGATALLDIGHMAETGRWLITLEDHVEMRRGSRIEIDAPLISLQPEAASAALRILADHLRCTFAFHLARGLSIRIQERLLSAWPLCSPELPEMGSLSPRTLDRGRVRITPFILPLHRDDPAIEGPLGRHDHAGFHVHRAGRALTLGGWLGIGAGRRDETARDRIRLLVEIGPELDDVWRVTLSKSGCAIPTGLKPAVRTLLADVLERAGRQRRSGMRSGQPVATAEGLWDSKRTIRRDHPLVRQVLAQSREVHTVELLLAHLEEERGHA